MHGYFILLNSAKMSKSSGEFLRVQLLIDKGYDPIAYRYLCLTAHYRSQLTFSWDALDAAQTALERLRNTAYGLGAPSTADQDLSTALWRCLTTTSIPAGTGADLRNAQVGPGAGRRKPPCSSSTKRSVLDWRAGYPRSRMFQPTCAPLPTHAGRPATQRLAGSDRLRGELTALGWTMKDGNDNLTLTRADSVLGRRCGVENPPLHSTQPRARHPVQRARSAISPKRERRARRCCRCPPSGDPRNAGWFLIEGASVVVVDIAFELPPLAD